MSSGFEILSLEHAIRDAWPTSMWKQILHALWRRFGDGCTARKQMFYELALGDRVTRYDELKDCDLGAV